MISAEALDMHGRSLLALSALLLMTACGDTTAVKEPEPTCRIILAGHIYSLAYRDHAEGDAGKLLDDRWLQAFADELRDQSPQATFLLGDSSRDGRPEEWQRLKGIMASVKSPIHYLAGNHDLRAPKVFDEQGGVRNAVFDYGGQRFITLDNKCIYEPDDLKFLESALSTNPSQLKPIILMHYLLIDWQEAPPGQDPREDYPGVSNWNCAVVPMIAGRVETVVCGDHLPGGPRHRQQVFEGKTIDYMLTSFVFSRASSGGAGEGPNIYLELVIEDGRVEFMPKLLSLPLSDAWYLDPREPISWEIQELSQNRGWLWLPPGFEREGSDSWIDAEKGIELSFLSRPLPRAVSRESVLSELSQELFQGSTDLQTITGGDFLCAGRKARWEWMDDAGARLFFAVVFVQDEVWILEGRQAAEKLASHEARGLLIAIAASLKLH